MANLNIDIKQGARFYRKITIKDEAGTPVDITGRTYKGQIRLTHKSSDVMGEFVFTLLDQTSNTGELEWVLPHTALTSIKTDKNITAFYDIEETLAGGDKEELFGGVVTIRPEVTK